MPQWEGFAQEARVHACHSLMNLLDLMPSIRKKQVPFLRMHPSSHLQLDIRYHTQRLPGAQ